jgi:hypothetical protein
MRIVRAAVLLNLLLCACAETNPISAPPVVYVPPSPPSEAAIGSGVKKLATDAKLTGALEISSVRPTTHGPGSYFFCVREVNAPAGQPRRYRSVFFDNDKYEGSRPSAILDGCEEQTYGPPPTVLLPKLEVGSGS